MPSWTIPTTRTSDELITATIWNADLVENLKYLKDAPAFAGNVTVGGTLGVTGAVTGGTLAVAGASTLTGKLTAPNSVIGLRGVDYTLPAADGTSGYALTTNGTGTLSWSVVSSNPYTVLSKTTTYTVATSDGLSVLILCTGTFTVTLYAAASNSGRAITVKNISTGTITVDGNASETIDGAATTTINAQYTSLTMVCDGSNWHIV